MDRLLRKNLRAECKIRALDLTLSLTLLPPALANVGLGRVGRVL